MLFFYFFFFFFNIQYYLPQPRNPEKVPVGRCYGGRGRPNSFVFSHLGPIGQWGNSVESVGYWGDFRGVLGSHSGLKISLIMPIL